MSDENAVETTPSRRSVFDDVPPVVSPDEESVEVTDEDVKLRVTEDFTRVTVGNTVVEFDHGTGTVPAAEAGVFLALPYIEVAD